MSSANSKRGRGRPGVPVGSELGDTQACSERILVIVALDDVGEREYSQRVERRRGFTEAIAARSRLVEGHGKDISMEYDEGGNIEPQRTHCDTRG